jgi:HEAT repeat protein
MTIIGKLASSLGRRDEEPNQELAREIIRTKDEKAIKELVDNLANKDKRIQGDCIKVLYEIGAERPDLIADYEKEFLNLLESKNNRLVWGAMTALDYIASTNPARIHRHLGKIMMASDNGSVITKDHAIGILIKLAGDKRFAKDAVSLLLDQLRSCATNQLPMYAENALKAIPGGSKEKFINVLTARLADLEKESGRKRIRKVIKKLGK